MSTIELNPQPISVQYAYTQPVTQVQPNPREIALNRFILSMIPEEQWKKIQTERVQMNPNPALEVTVQRTNATFLERFFTPDPKKTYTSHIKAAENALKKNIEALNKGEPLSNLDKADLVHYEKAISLVKPGYRASLYAKEAHAWMLRHMPADQLVNLFINERPFKDEREVAEQAIFASREAIEGYQLELAGTRDLINVIWNDYALQERKSPKCLNALETLSIALEELEILRQSSKTPHYSPEEAIAKESKILSTLYQQVCLLMDHKAFSDELPALIRTVVEIFADLYFLQATEYERLASIMPDYSNSPLTEMEKRNILNQRNILNITTPQECLRFAKHDYAVAQNLLMEMEAQANLLEDVMKAKQHLKSNKTGECEVILNENDKEVKKLRTQQKSIRETLFAIGAAMERLKLIRNQ